MVRILCALMLVILLARTARADSIPDSNVIAHASDDMLWVAQVLAAPEVKPSGEKTAIRFRALNTADQSWHELPSIAGRAIQIANRGQTAAVLLKSGEWELLWPDGDASGPPLPRREKMLALASERDRNTLYAVGLPNTGATTESSDAATSQPATQANIDPNKPLIYAFEGANWKALANLPDAPASAMEEVSLAVVARMPTLALRESNRSIHVYQLDESSKWIDRGSIKPPAESLGFRLLSGTLRPTLWVNAKDSGGLLYLGGEKWQPPVTLALSKPMSPVNASLVSAAGALRLFIADDKGKLYEQRFQSTGQKIADLAPLPMPIPVLPPGYDNWPMFAILAAVAVMMLSSSRRRDEVTDKDADQIILATPGQRLMAGLIDAAPIVLAVLYIANNQKALTDPSESNWTWIIPLLLAIVIYLAHTTLSELVSGRTLGKICVGLQVLTVDGKPAGVGAILIRNMLRLIDVFPIPLALLIITSPMKQRLGDMLAGTIVVIRPRSEEDEEDKSNS